MDCVTLPLESLVEIYFLMHEMYIEMLFPEDVLVFSMGGEGGRITLYEKHVNEKSFFLYRSL